MTEDCCTITKSSSSCGVWLSGRLPSSSGLVDDYQQISSSGGLADEGGSRE